MNRLTSPADHLVALPAGEPQGTDQHADQLVRLDGEGREVQLPTIQAQVLFDNLFAGVQRLSQQVAERGLRF